MNAGRRAIQPLIPAHPCFSLRPPQILRATQHLQAAGVVHRDIKPHMLVDSDCSLKVRTRGPTDRWELDGMGWHGMAWHGMGTLITTTHDMLEI